MLRPADGGRRSASRRSSRSCRASRARASRSPPAASLGLDRDAAARFSFLLLIPIVLGAVLYKGLKHVVLDPLPAGSTGPFVVGTIASAAVGLVAIDVLLGYVRRHSYLPFVIYRLVVAALIVIVIASRLARQRASDANAPVTGWLRCGDGLGTDPSRAARSVPILACKWASSPSSQRRSTPTNARLGVGAVAGPGGHAAAPRRRRARPARRAAVARRRRARLVGARDARARAA